MKISATHTTQPQPAATSRESRDPDGNNKATHPEQATKDSLSLSTAARKQYAADSNSAPVPDGTRVSAFKQAIEAGTYESNFQRIAEKLYQSFTNLQQVHDHDSH